MKRLVFPSIAERVAKIFLGWFISAGPGFGAEFHVSTNGAVSGDGSLSNPLSISKALSSTSPARPGDTIWIHGGTYNGVFSGNLVGTPDRPIVVRQFQNDRVILNSLDIASTVLSINGSNTHYWGLEIANQNTDRSPIRGVGVGFNTSVAGENNKLINCVIHDTGGGVFISSISTNAEVSGCVIFNNGWQGPSPDRGHGHGLYAQSITDSKLIRDNIIFNQYGFGIQLYTVASRIDHFKIDRNILFRNGILASDHFQLNVLIGGQTIQDIQFTRNLLYVLPGDPNSANMQLTWGSMTNGTAVVTNNYFAGAGPEIANWTNMTFSGNTMVSSGKSTRFRPIDQVGVYDWNRNTYVTDIAEVFQIVSGPGLTWDAWRGRGFDLSSTLVRAASPAQPDVTLNSNPHQPGRANLTVFNWPLRSSISVDLSSVLAVGASFEIRNVQDYTGVPVVSSVFDGGPVTVPLNNLAVSTPVGMASAPPSTSPLFNVFVVNSLRPPTPGNIRVVGGQ